MKGFRESAKAELRIESISIHCLVSKKKQYIVFIMANQQPKEQDIAENIHQMSPMNLNLVRDKE